MNIPQKTTQLVTFGEWAQEAIAIHYKKMLKHEQAVLADQNPEELHQMRVGMRRLRSALVGFAPALDVSKRMTQEQVGKCARTLGKLRDLDVMAIALREYRPHLPKAEKQYLKEALNVIAVKRKRAYKKVHKLLTGKQYSKLKAAFEDWLDQPQYQAIATADIQLVLPDLLSPQLSELLLHPGWWIVNPQEQLTPLQVDSLIEDRNALLHDLRKTAKRSRYNMELFSQFYGENYDQYLQDIKQVQTIIGELQDYAVIANFLAQHLGGKPASIVPALAAYCTRHRYETWQSWQLIQQKFLDPVYRHRLHQELCTPSTINTDSVNGSLSNSLAAQ